MKRSFSAQANAQKVGSVHSLLHPPVHAAAPAPGGMDQEESLNSYAELFSILC